MGPDFPPDKVTTSIMLLLLCGKVPAVVRISTVSVCVLHLQFCYYGDQLPDTPENVLYISNHQCTGERLIVGWDVRNER